MKVSFKNLNGAYECARRRERNIESAAEVSTIKEIAKTTKNVILMALKGEIKHADIAANIESAFLQIDFKSEKERAIKADMERQNRN